MSNAIRKTHAMRLVMASFLEAAPKPLAGADILNRQAIFAGTLYPVLARLEATGHLTSIWEDIDPREVGRPRRRFYKLTPTGRRFAQECAHELEEQLGRMQGWQSHISRFYRGARHAFAL